MSGAVSLSIAAAQLDPTVGDIGGNAARIREARARAAEAGADLLVTAELAICGYPPEDLVLKPSFQDESMAMVHNMAAETADGGPAVLVGTPWRHGDHVYNAAVLLDEGVVKAVRFKRHLPNYGVFDEERLFHAGPLPEPVDVRGLRVGVMLCEDMWYPDVASHLRGHGSALLVVLNGSPFELGKVDVRLEHALGRVGETHLPLVYVNQVGGQDELVFDGASFVLDGDGRMRARAPSWREAVEVSHWACDAEGWCCPQGEVAAPLDDCEDIYQALKCGLRDYVAKNGFPGVIVGLSGGIDSALTAAVAVDTLGPDRVHCVLMPSPYTARESVEDARELAALLGTELTTINIEPAMEAFQGMLSDAFAGTPPGTAEENVQARARGIILMALSNKRGDMVVSTGNKSEMSVGYATLYGDMAGGYSVLKDVYKTTVFQLCRWRNGQRPHGALGPAGQAIPERIISKPPSAELKPNQKDQDTLPPYDVLDPILKGLVEDEKAVRELVVAGFDEAVVGRVWRMLNQAEYKRRQAPPGVKITPRAFGRDRRYPITNAFRLG